MCIRINKTCSFLDFYGGAKIDFYGGAKVHFYGGAKIHVYGCAQIRSWRSDIGFPLLPQPKHLPAALPLPLAKIEQLVNTQRVQCVALVRVPKFTQCAV